MPHHGHLQGVILGDFQTQILDMLIIDALECFKLCVLRHHLHHGNIRLGNQSYKFLASRKEITIDRHRRITKCCVASAPWRLSRR